MFRFSSSYGPENKWSFASYSYLLSTNSFITSLKSTLFITVVGTILKRLCGHVQHGLRLTEKSLIAPGAQQLYLRLVVLTLVFNAGIVPNYLLIRSLI